MENHLSETADIATRILELTKSIPPHVLRTPGINAARQFKEVAARCRTVASSPASSLGKLRQALADLQFYYR